MKKLAMIAIMTSLGCAPMIVGPGEIESGGTLCQGSRAWVQQSACSRGAGQCIRAIDGPYILTGIRAGAACDHPIKASISDTFGAYDQTSKPRWSVDGDVQGVLIVINPGESLYFGTDGFNELVDGKCFVTWSGHRP